MSIKKIISIHNGPLHLYVPQEAFCSMFCGQFKKTKKKKKKKNLVKKPFVLWKLNNVSSLFKTSNKGDFI
jgi:thioredoxin-related protein